MQQKNIITSHLLHRESQSSSPSFAAMKETITMSQSVPLFFFFCQTHMEDLQEPCYSLGEWAAIFLYCDSIRDRNVDGEAIHMTSVWW
ncbi:hypothetical protein CEXT_299371 [Caerostris extrusa]|uniref:Uncharacterized protein n=1 Tax=Caerostris extrusa TaxID=172846 RepID=A0AAV4R3E4_CAEEX|nr:hypothetical protein CEXT_299371 [Caerostris extrusa]